MLDRMKPEGVEKIMNELRSLDEDIPEPDWAEFRSSVRDRLLSRSIQRTSAVRRWTGWSIRPAVAWALSVVIAVAVTTGVFLWNIERRLPVATPEPQISAAALETDAGDTDRPVWTQPPLFDDLLQLGDDEEQQLRQMLEAEQADQGGNVSLQ